MIKIVSIRLRNFRVVKEGTFKPLKDGITGLSGANGAGKSSFLSGVLWALYGVRPEGVPLAGLRNQYASYEDECSVSVILEHEGQTIEIIRELRGKNNRTIINIFVDGKEQTVTSVGTSEKWIASRLKIDSNAFMTAFVIRQKELDSLIKATPAERRVLIERLSGIEAMSVALRTARAEESEAKKTLSGLPGSQEDLEMAHSLANDQESRVDDLEVEVKDSDADYKAKEKISNQLNNQHNELLHLERKYVNQVSQTEEARRQFHLAQTSLDNAKKLLSEHIREYPSIDMENITLLEKQVQDRQSELQDAEQTLQQARIQMNSFENTMSSLVIEQERLEAALHSLANEAEEINGHLQTIQDQQDELQSAEQELQVVETEANAIVSSISRLGETKRNLDESIEKIKSVTHENHAECPTCHSVLDEPQNLLDSLEATLSPLPALIEEDEKKLNQKRAEYTQVLRGIQTLKSSLARQDDLLARQNRITASLEENQKALSTVTERIAKGQEKIKNFSLDQEEAAVQQARDSYEKARTAWGEVEILKRANNTGQRLEFNVSQARKTVETAMDTLRVAEETLAITQKVTTRDTEASKKLYNEALQETNAAQVYFNTEERNLLVARERLNAFQKDVATQEAYMSRRSAGLELLRAKTAVSDVLDEFRKNKIATIAPELSETATTLISTMTSGHYTEVVLDENFTPSVVDIEGVVRPVSWLSGGEESVVALALRIAIGDLMTGGEGGLLWLDEVLTAQDATRRSSLLEALRNISNKQIIMINHTQDAMDIVDKTVTVVREDNEGSVIADDSNDAPFAGEDIELP